MTAPDQRDAPAATPASTPRAPAPSVAERATQAPPPPTTGRRAAPSAGGADAAAPPPPPGDDAVVLSPAARRALRWRALTRRLLPYAIVAVGGFLLAYLFVFFFVFPSDLVPTVGRVPNVVGLLYDDAENRLESAGLKAKQGETRFHATAPKNAVLEQAPRPGVALPRGAVVTLDVSGGQRTATVPRVVGATQQQAQVLLENAGFDVGDVVARRGTAPRGQVLATEPGEGQTVALPRTVTLTVSGGPPTVTLPDVLGRSLGEARSALEQLGLAVAGVTVDSTSFSPPDVVTAQTPASGSAVVAGTGVKLTVSGRAP